MTIRVDPSTLSDLVVYADESGDHGRDVRCLTYCAKRKDSRS
jgi:hypothetical protein